MYFLYIGPDEDLFKPGAAYLLEIYKNTIRYATGSGRAVCVEYPDFAALAADWQIIKPF